MLRLLWVMIQIGLLVGGALWLAARPGTIDINWMEREISIPFGHFLFALFVLVLSTIGLTRLMIYITKTPERMRVGKQFKNTEKGLNALTLSLSSAASGDYGHAQFQAERAAKLLPGHQPVPLLLKAGSQRKQGQFEASEQTLTDLLSDKEGAVLAARALIGTARESGNIAKALTYARTAARDYEGKDKGWLYQTLYELEAVAGNWEDAQKNLDQALKKKAISKEQAAKDFIAIATERARLLKDRQDDKGAVKLLKAALKKDPAFIPTIEVFFVIHVEQQKKRSAYNLIKKAWGVRPHPSLYQLWTQVGGLYGKEADDLPWLQKLLKTNPDHIESYYALAQCQANNANYEAAKEAIEKAITLDPQRRFYKLRAELAEKSGASEASIRHHLEELSEAKADPTWICIKTGLVYESWRAIAKPHNSFNMIEWSSPSTITANSLQAINAPQTIDYLMASN